jgi:hypothetical protein
MLQADHFRVQYDGHPPFFMTLLINNKCLNNCMLDSGAGANMMSLKDMEKLGLNVTRPYRNVCGFESRAIPTHGVVENVEACLGRYLERVIHMDIVVVDVPDVWGMILSGKFIAMLRGTLEMDLTYINMPMNDGTISRLPNMPMTRVHIQEIGDDIGIDETHEPIKESLPVFSPDDLPFASEEDFDQIQWLKKEYQQLLNKYKDKEVGTVKLLNKGEDDILIRPSQQEVFAAESHPLPQDNTQGLCKRQPNLRPRITKPRIQSGCGIQRREILLMSKEVHNFGLVPSELEGSRSMISLMPHF